MLVGEGVEGKWTVYELPANGPTQVIHIIPPDRGPIHRLSTSCWCMPVLDLEAGSGSLPIWIHRELH